MSWTQTNAPTLSWTCVASDSTGQYLVAGSDSAIYTSTDSGVTWDSNNNAPTNGWTCVASDSSGQYLVAGSFYYNEIYTSTDSGVTWDSNNNAPTTDTWISVASDSTGQNLVACTGNSASGPNIYIDL
jgi:hypothetical protein